MERDLEIISIRVSNGFMINYSYIVFDKRSKNCLLIDPSWEPHKVWEHIQKREGLLTDIFLTHSHIDHVYSLPYFLQKTNSKVWVSKVEADYYSFQSLNLFNFKHEQKIQWNSHSIEAILTPGHTKGSACFLIENHLFTGDTLFGEGCGLCNSLGGSPDDMFESIQFLKSKVNVDTCIYPGHSYGINPGKTYDYVEKKNIYLQINNKTDFVNFRNRKIQKGHFDFR